MCNTMRNITSNWAGAFKLLLMGVFFLATLTTFAQEAKILKGQIVDSEGNPISGAIVNVAESSRIVLSDADGYFSLENVKVNDEITVTSVGYKSKILNAEFTEDFQIVLASDLDRYAHTTPVGFDRKKKKFVTEATSVVTGEELEKHPITVLQNAFTSTVTGVATYEWASEPGWTESAIYIRGIRTMNQNARSPLVIVDDVERILRFWTPIRLKALRS